MISPKMSSPDRPTASADRLHVARALHHQVRAAGGEAGAEQGGGEGGDGRALLLKLPHAKVHSVLQW